MPRLLLGPRRTSAGRLPGSATWSGASSGWTAPWPGWMCCYTGSGGGCRSPGPPRRRAGQGGHRRVAGGDLARAPPGSPIPGVGSRQPGSTMCPGPAPSLRKRRTQASSRRVNGRAQPITHDGPLAWAPPGCRSPPRARFRRCHRHVSRAARRSRRASLPAEGLPGFCRQAGSQEEARGWDLVTPAAS